ncbi:Uracil DNA glycosylase superfamily protein [Brevundimonas sp. SH203]|uniref:uracil-DNA glycosylase n=1 Tax=Brevundimonas sp. SH203 TaxID=345167 RepID=UPI0009C79D8F|nr:uracil-DNA glycosylase [Brevundimonas sp. SH203]GAW39754.1 Uracil DNA glycosylase superfamily protein [Brevundimonas sp. SH203]
MTPSEFVCALEAASLPNVFNPWRDHCAVHDRGDAAALRRENLRLFLDRAIATEVSTMWVGRDLGYRGGRRTGVPFTDEVHLATASTLLGDIDLIRATEGPVMAERTAAVIWRVLEQVRQPVVLWNVFPFHPHMAGDPMSNRCHTRAERDETWPLLEALVEMVQPRRIIAIGRDASLALADLGVDADAIRHPSYGGQAEFMSGMFALYSPSATGPPLFDAVSPPLGRRRLREAP